MKNVFLTLFLFLFTSSLYCDGRINNPTNYFSAQDRKQNEKKSCRRGDKNCPHSHYCSRCKDDRYKKREGRYNPNNP